METLTAAHRLLPTCENPPCLAKLQEPAVHLCSTLCPTSAVPQLLYASQGLTPPTAVHEASPHCLQGHHAPSMRPPHNVCMATTHCLHGLHTPSMRPPLPLMRPPYTIHAPSTIHPCGLHNPSMRPPHTIHVASTQTHQPCLQVARDARKCSHASTHVRAHACPRTRAGRPTGAPTCVAQLGNASLS